MLSSPYRPSSSPSSSSSSASASLCSASGFTLGNTRLLSSSSAAWYSALPARNLSCHRPLVFLRAARPLAPLHRMVPRVLAFSFFSWLGTYMARFPRRSVGHWPRPRYAIARMQTGARQRCIKHVPPTVALAKRAKNSLPSASLRSSLSGAGLNGGRRPARLSGLLSLLFFSFIFSHISSLFIAAVRFSRHLVWFCVCWNCAEQRIRRRAGRRCAAWRRN
ncbi:hypothetical protein TGME49_202375 [Toxoplasma gondii ME49]|uniref:Transmembrane protein n=1 Tax=Toxoplasma gondii (strain ATCC 50611 / Me49) TaxID=508771 RepID=S8GEG5_TOXGM|nr:hypothetical protein TGME49_202375 [Toxoplasma gondii ME49]EPT30230.1 hypothetical protein TGME49_202375 [Toxoplasma gondii ME49]|eukprot:XP_018637404.1 hypothetical protein TGME49_202375 [Toxoplasma gondii ME49]